MVCPLVKVPEMMPALDTEIVCNCPAAKPFCCILLTVGVPFVLANWVIAPAELFSEMLPKDAPLTVTPLSATLLIAGLS